MHSSLVVAKDDIAQASAIARDNPMWFHRNILNSTENDQWQEEMYEAVADVYRHKAGLPTKYNHEGLNKITVRAMHGPGKEQPISEPVLTPAGWRTMGDLRPGDSVIAGDGTNTLVKMTHPQGVKPVFRFVLSDGSYVRAGLDHLWKVHERIGGNRRWRIVTTAEMLQRGIKDSSTYRYKLPTCGAVEFNGEVPFDPYALGAWLGDGIVGTGSICKPDAGLWAELGCAEWGRNKAKTIGGLRHALVGLDLLDKKSPERFIPDCYLLAEVSSRHSLLQGLLDTDGWVEDNGASVYYSTASKKLAWGVVDIVRSLGGQIRWCTNKSPKYLHNGEHKIGLPAYLLKITLPARFPPFRAKTKANRLMPIDDFNINRRRALSRFVVSIEPDGWEESVCITVEHPEHLYITRDYVVTHNTYGVAGIMHWFNFCFYGTIVCTAPKEKQLRTRLWPAFRKINSKANPGYQELIKVDASKIVWANDEDWVAHAETASEPENLAGYHSDYLLFIVDEATGVKEDMYPVIEGAVSTGKLVIIILIGNPTKNIGTFYDSHMTKRVAKNYYQIHVDLSKTKRVNKDWVRQMEEKYGKDSPIVQIRCYGNFADANENQLISLPWLMDAKEQDFAEDGSLPWLRVSVDVADGGEDETVITVARHYTSFTHYLKQARFSFPAAESPILSAQAAARMFDEYGGRLDGDDDLVVDSIGVGAGCAGHLVVGVPQKDGTIKKYPVVVYKGGEASDNKDMWRNRRVQTHMVGRDELRDGRAVFAEDFADENDWEDFCAQMCSIHTNPSNERVEDLETKEHMKKRGIKSPDMAESWMMQHATQAPTQYMNIEPTVVGETMASTYDAGLTDETIW